ncbi:hypothetical protein [Nocardia gamkensis]|uniref:Uncharacterized protein n=1 Tax=Nocardia gamkensis TaxID=352869 RepID=A0A7X6L5V1_9NOCA|nr:hypothetical protein [Nocardia gamkensis]NKY28235.1 hypothetical protein [Nocardia gamkensis]NQE70744.1 Cytidine deaminase [Nocardia gamkensis]
MKRLEYPRGGQIRIALFGAAGSGKSTTAGMIETICGRLGVRFALVKLGEPLYEAQYEIYRLAGRPLDDKYIQDGELLSFLGRHLRKINPTALIDAFRFRLENLSSSIQSGGPERTIILCDDMRFPDWEYLHELGFIPIRISADTGVCERRQRLRGDYHIKSVPARHESNLDSIMPEFTIENSGSMDSLELDVEQVMTELLS